MPQSLTIGNNCRIALNSNYNKVKRGAVLKHPVKLQKKRGGGELIIYTSVLALLIYAYIPRHQESCSVTQNRQVIGVFITFAEGQDF